MEIIQIPSYPTLCKLGWLKARGLAAPERVLRTIAICSAVVTLCIYNDTTSDPKLQTCLTVHLHSPPPAGAHSQSYTDT